MKESMYGEDVLKIIPIEFKRYVKYNGIEIDCELDKSEAVNDFMCRCGYYGEDVYDMLMNTELYK